MHAAKFPVHHALAGFDFESSNVGKTLIDELATLAFSEQSHNVVFIGDTGTGKTHLAAPWVYGVAKRVLFYSTVDLVNLLE